MLLGNACFAQGNVNFGAAPAVFDPLAASNPGSINVLPGITRVVMPPATPELSDQAMKARVLPPDLNRGVSS
jgi:hypothetical protein